MLTVYEVYDLFLAYRYTSMIFHVKIDQNRIQYDQWDHKLKHPKHHTFSLHSTRRSVGSIQLLSELAGTRLKV